MHALEYGNQFLSQIISLQVDMNGNFKLILVLRMVNDVLV